MNDSERILWAALVLSETRLGFQRGLIDHEVNVRLRRRLVTEYGLDLDVLTYQAVEIVDKLEEQTTEEREAEERRLNDAEERGKAAAALVRQLLSKQKHKNDES